MAQKFVVEFGKDTSPPLDDGRLDAPAFRRNSAPILAVVTRLLGGARAGHVLEIGSGTGQHIVAFARSLPGLTWWPSDPNAAHRRSIEAWRGASGLGNIMAPVDLDASRREWPLGTQGFPPEELVAIVSINVIHIAPWPVAEGLLAAAARCLRPDGHLILYGPYAVGGAHTAPSNAAFDASLRAQNPQWGVRDTGDIAALAGTHGLMIADTVAMPANNLMLVLTKDG